MQDLKLALAKLPDEQQSALLLMGKEGMRYDEAAAVLGVLVGRLAAVARPRSVAIF